MNLAGWPAVHTGHTATSCTNEDRLHMTLDNAEFVMRYTMRYEGVQNNCSAILHQNMPCRWHGTNQSSDLADAAGQQQIGKAANLQAKSGKESHSQRCLCGDRLKSGKLALQSSKALFSHAASTLVCHGCVSHMHHALFSAPAQPRQASSCCTLNVSCLNTS